MQLQELIEKMGLKPLTQIEDREVTGVFITDMLSDVMASSKAGNVWLTVQTDKNVVSAANLVDIAAVVVTHGKTVPDGTIQTANRFHVNILGTDLATFDLAKKMILTGLGG
jgi:predicted transcriptional regulator